MKESIFFDAGEREKSNRENWIFILLAIVFVFLISICYINEDNGIKIWPDEIGFWQNAALLNGYDWSGTGSSISYYGFGFGFLLAPLMSIFKSSESLMHAAVILQSLMLCSTIIATYLILYNLELNIGKIAQKVLIILPALYSSYLLFTRITLAETVLTTCMWWWLYSIIKLIKSKSFLAGFFTILIPLYMYAVHQRSLPYILIAFVIILINFVSEFKKTRKIKELFLCFLLLVIVIIGFASINIYDNHYISELYSNSGNYTANTVSGQTNGILQKFSSLEGWASIIQSICGKIFYSIVATYGLVFWGIITGIYSGYLLITKKSENIIADIFFALIFINFLASIGVASLAMLDNYSVRNDILMYGRYSEFSYGAMIFIGGITLYQNLISSSNKRKIITIECITVLLLCFVCMNLTHNEASNDIFWVSCSALGDLLWFSKKYGISNKEIILIAGIRTILFMILTYFIFNKHKTRENLLTLWLLTIAVSWILIANVGWKQNVMSWYENQEKNQIDIVQDLEEEAAIGIFDVDYPGCLQFLLPSTYFENIDALTSLSDQYEGMYIITDSTSKYARQIISNYSIEKRNDRYILWIYE